MSVPISDDGCELVICMIHPIIHFGGLNTEGKSRTQHASKTLQHHKTTLPSSMDSSVFIPGISGQTVKVVL